MRKLPIDHPVLLSDDVFGRNGMNIPHQTLLKVIIVGNSYLNDLRLISKALSSLVVRRDSFGIGIGMINDDQANSNLDMPDELTEASRVRLCTLSLVVDICPTPGEVFVYRDYDKRIIVWGAKQSS